MRTLVFATTLLLAMAATASAEEDCQLKRYGVVPFETDETAHVFLRATIDGHPGRLMLDTGAFWSMLSRAYAEANNLRIGNSLFIEMRDATGDKIDKMTTAELKLGNLGYGPAEFFIGGLGGEESKDEVSGVIGQNLLAKVDLEIDNAGKTISLFSQEHCKGAGVYWADEAVTLQYKKQPARAPIGSNLKKKDPNQIDMPVVAAELDGEVVSILFDTGATYSVIDIEHAKRRFGLKTDSPGVKPAGKLQVANGGIVDSYSYTFKVLTIAGIKFENVPVRLSTLEGSQMLLGMNEIKHLRLYFASKDGMIHITAADAGRPQQ
jgi:predicted aspartyl protease